MVSKIEEFDITDEQATEMQQSVTDEFDIAETDIKSIEQSRQQERIGKEFVLGAAEEALGISEEETDVHAAAAKQEEGLAFLYSVKRETVCRAIVGLNGEKIPEIIEDETEKKQRHMWLRENVVKGWNQILVDAVWAKYAVMLSEVETSTGGEIKAELPEKEEKNEK